MRTTNDFFYTNGIDRSIPDLQKSYEFYINGETEKAEKAFSDYIKQALKEKVFNSLPITLPEGTGGVPEEQYADEVLEGYVVSVGFKYCFENGIIDWTHNPTFNKYCEFSFHLQYHNELLVLARAYERTEDEKYAKRFDYMINSWLEQAICPENESGFNGRPLWRTIEAGGRMARTWPYMINSFLNSPSIPDKTWVNIFKSVCDHGHRLTKNNTRSTHNNWIINEMIGLLTMGLNFPFMKDAKYWVEYALECMKDELAIQIYPDGMQIELTTGYHGGIIGNYQKAETVLRLYGATPPKVFDDYIRLMYTMYTQICRPDLHTPGLNDGGEADVIRATQNALRRYPDDQELRFFASKRAEGKSPDYLTRILPYAGFYVTRTGWGENDIWAFLDAGPEGLAHIHEDKLAFQLSAYGCNMLADTGTYAYDTSDMRKYAIGSRSHSTGMVDGCSQNRITRHHWNLQEYAKRPIDLKFTLSDDMEIAQGSYDQGYGPDFINVKHTRRVIFFKKGINGSLPFFLLYDTFASEDKKEHLYEVSFQHRIQNICACAHTTQTKYPNGASLTMVSDAYPKIMIGQYVPEFVGWKPIHSPKEHEHLPVPVVSYSKKGLKAEFATVLYPSPTENAPDISVSVNNEIITLNINGFEMSIDTTSEQYLPKTTVDSIK